MTLKERVQWAEDHGFSQADMARACGITSGAVSQWKSTGKTIRGDSALALAKLTGWPAEWWLTGKGPPPGKGLGKFTLGKFTPLDVQPVTLLPSVTWGDVVAGLDLPEVFTLNAPDDAMAPTIRQGRGVIWSTKKAPTVGAGILVRDKTGQVHMRRMHQGTSEHHFIAVPINPAFRTLDSSEDDLTVLAVLDGIRGGLDTIA